VLGSRPLQHLLYSSFATDNRGIFCFVWLDDGGDVCDRYVRDLLKVSKTNMPDYLVTIILNESENTFMDPDWWGAFILKSNCGFPAEKFA
jgi:hypothetical protein